jgi:DNA-binding MarR family transcriptional regulator
VSSGPSATHDNLLHIPNTVPSNGLARRAAETRQLHEREILAQLETRRPITQRSLSSQLGIALGLTNLVMRRLVKKGWVRIKPISARRILYLITPAGIAAKAELTRQYFLNSLAFYRDARTRMGERLGVLSAELHANGDGPHAVAFYGAGEAAEVAYICLREVGLQLSGVIDPANRGSFFDVRVQPPSELNGATLSGRPFSRLIVMPLQPEEDVRQVLAARQVPPEHVFWI